LLFGELDVDEVEEEGAVLFGEEERDGEVVCLFCELDLKNSLGERTVSFL
jgi:hypothetical protein